MLKKRYDGTEKIQNDKDSEEEFRIIEKFRNVLEALDVSYSTEFESSETYIAPRLSITFDKREFIKEINDLEEKLHLE